MPVYSFLTGTYARNIYLYGTRTFSMIPMEYHQPVKHYAAQNFTLAQLEQSVARSYISEQEYQETMSIVGDNPFVLPQGMTREEL